MILKNLSHIGKVVLVTATLSLISTTTINASTNNHIHTSECKQIQTLEKHKHTGSTGECYGDCGTFLLYGFSSNEYGHGYTWKCDVCGVTTTVGHPYSPDGSECDHINDRTVLVNEFGGDCIYRRMF